MYYTIPDVEIGFTVSETSIMESQLSESVCINITRGILERNITAHVSIDSDSQGILIIEQCLFVLHNNEP